MVRTERITAIGSDHCSFPPKKPQITDDEIQALLTNIDETLSLMVGPTHSKLIMESIKDGLDG